MPDASARIENGKIVLKTDYSHLKYARLIQGRKWDANRRVWTVPATGVCCQNVIDFIKKVGGSCSDQITQMANGAAMREKVIATDNPKGLPFDAMVKTEPMEHQYRGYLMQAWSDAAFPAWDMGTGKSKIVVDLICNGAINSINLIVAPKKVCSNWPAEFRVHGSRETELVHLAQGSAKKTCDTLIAALSKDRKCPLVCLINYDVVWRSSVAALITKHKWNLTVLDESHRAKTHNKKTGKFIANDLREASLTRMCLSGTPMPNSPLDIFNQFLFLDPGIHGTSYTAFKARYTTSARVTKDGDKLIIECGYSPKMIQAFKKIPGAYFRKNKDGTFWINENPEHHKEMLDAVEKHKKEIKQHIGYQNLDELAALNAKIMHRISKDEALDLPDLIFKRVEIEISDECKRLCHELETELETQLEEDGPLITAQNGLVKSLRLLQIASGITKDTDGNEHIVDHAKKEALYEHLCDLPADDKIIVFYNFTLNATSINEACDDAERPCFFINGATDDIDEWRDRAPSGAVIAVQIQAGGEGINLTAAHWVIYYSTGNRLDKFLQSLSRAHRKGQKHKTTVIHLTAKDTMEVKVSQAFEAKEEVIDYVFASMKNPIEGVA